MSADRRVPDCHVSVAGKVLSPAEEGRLVAVDVDLDVDLFGCCSLTFNDPKLELINSTKFQSGTAIKVEIGFAPKLQQVFEGEVVGLEPRFLRDKPPALKVIAQESLHRLALSQMTRTFNDADDKEIVTKIAQEHGLQADGPAGTKGHHLQANVSDATFLRRVAQKQGHHLRIEGKKLVIAPPPKGTDVVLDPSSGIQRGKVRLSSLAQVTEVTVHGWDPKTKKEIVGKAKPKGDTGEGATKYGKGTLAVAGHEYAPTDQATAEKMAEGRLRKLAEGFASIKLDVIGDARMLPGANLELQKLGQQIDGVYRVEKALHRFSKHGYWVSLRAVRTAKKTAAQKSAEKEAKVAQEEQAAQAAEENDRQEEARRRQVDRDRQGAPKDPWSDEPSVSAGVWANPETEGIEAGVEGHTEAEHAEAGVEGETEQEHLDAGVESGA